MPTGIYKKNENLGYWKGKKLSPEHRKKLSEAHKGKTPWNKGRKAPEKSRENHHNWNGGKQKTWNGYIIVLKPNHPFCDKHGHVREHRLVMEKHLGRHLKPTEIVHHISKSRDDNRIENLMLFPSISAHMRYHAQLRKLKKLMTPT